MPPQTAQAVAHPVRVDHNVYSANRGFAVDAAPGRLHCFFRKLRVSALSGDATHVGSPRGAHPLAPKRLTEPAGDGALIAELAEPGLLAASRVEGRPFADQRRAVAAVTAKLPGKHPRSLGYGRPCGARRGPAKKGQTPRVGPGFHHRQGSVPAGRVLPAARLRPARGANRIAVPQMRPIRRETTIDVPRERLFELLSDLANRPAFCDHFQRELRLERLQSTGVGAAARFRVEAPRAAVWMETVIEELEPPYRIYEGGHAGRLDRIPVFTVWELVEGAGETTEVAVSFWTQPSHPLDRLRERLGAQRWYRRQWERALRRLRELAELGEPLRRVGVAGGSHEWS